MPVFFAFVFMQNTSSYLVKHQQICSGFPINFSDQEWQHSDNTMIKPSVIRVKRMSAILVTNSQNCQHQDQQESVL